MSIAIPLACQKRLLRLISARADMQYASDAFRRFMACPDNGARYHFFLSMVLAYCRPFTENNGIGSLRCEYPTFPDFADADMNLRHTRLLDLRNKFLGHSSIEGTRVYLVGPGAVSPMSGRLEHDYGWAIEKLMFSGEERFASWLHDLILTLSLRLNDDIKLVVKEVGSNYLKSGEVYVLDTGKNPFEWTQQHPAS